MTGYAAGFSGLMASSKPATYDIALRIPRASHHRHTAWPKVLKEIIAHVELGTLRRPLCLYGHSMGAEAVLEICAALARLKIHVDYVGIIDLTLGPVTKAGNNITILQEFHSQFQRVSFDGFIGDHQLYELDELMGENIGHSEAAKLEFTQNMIVETISNLQKGVSAMTDKPQQLIDMIDAQNKALNPANETPEKTAFNKAFFDTIRPQFGSISLESINGMKRIIYAFDTYIKPSWPPANDNLLAFALGQIFNETGGKMVPIRETGASTHDKALAILDGWWKSGKAKKAGVTKPYWTSGFYGRGLFQETHEVNYSKAGMLWEKWFGFKLDFVKEPDLMLEILPSALSAFIGSIEGKYTGAKFEDFCKDGTCDFAGMRKIVNGDSNIKYRDVDGDGVIELMAEEIADVSENFLAAITAGRNAKTTDVAVVPPIIKTPTPEGDFIGMMNRQEELLLAILEAVSNKDDVKIKTIDLIPTKVEPSGQITEGNDEVTGFTETKSIFKSKRIWGLATVVVGLFFPQAQPIIDILTPTVTGATPEIVDQLQDRSVLWIEQGKIIISAIGVLIASWGSVTAKQKLTLPFKKAE